MSSSWLSFLFIPLSLFVLIFSPSSWRKIWFLCRFLHLSVFSSSWLVLHTFHLSILKSHSWCHCSSSSFLWTCFPSCSFSSPFSHFDLDGGHNNPWLALFLQDKRKRNRFGDCKRLSSSPSRLSWCHAFACQWLFTFGPDFHSLLSFRLLILSSLSYHKSKDDSWRAVDRLGIQMRE